MTRGGTTPSDLSLLLARLVTGAFLIHGVWDNVSDAGRMEEFATFLSAHHFPAPRVLAPLTVYAQLAIGLLLIAGAFVRATGGVLAAMFVVAIAMVHRAQSPREIWPAAALVLIGAMLATMGGGRYALDARRRKGNR